MRSMIHNLSAPEWLNEANIGHGCC